MFSEWTTQCLHGRLVKSCVPRKLLFIGKFEPRGRLLISFFFSDGMKVSSKNIKVSSELCLNIPAYVSENL